MSSAFKHKHIIKLRGMSSGGISSFKRGLVDGICLILDHLQCTLHEKLNEWQEHQEFII
jgi:hypothetical protein